MRWPWGGAGSWIMEGPNNMRASTREVTLTDVDESHSGVYTSYYLNQYNEISNLNYTLTVTNIVDVTSVSLNATAKTLLENKTFQLIATIAPTDATNKDVTWSSSDGSVATVSASGLVTTKIAGTATITVTTEDGDKTASCVITVKKEDEPQPPLINVTGVSLNITEETIIKGGTIQLEAIVTPADATNKGVTWSSSDGSVATVSASGLVTTKVAGTATITVTTEDGYFTATCEIVVISPTSIEQVNGKELKVYTVGNLLFIHSPQQEVIRIYAITGQLLVEKEKQAGQSKITLPTLPQPVLIVRGSSGWVKKLMQ